MSLASDRFGDKPMIIDPGSPMIVAMANAFLDLIRTLVLFGAAAYGVLLFFLYFTQDGMLYLPDLPSRQLEATPKTIGLDYREVWIETEDEETLHGWYVPTVDARATVLFFHGNAGNISHRLTSLSQMNSLGLNVLIFDYRGYGKSSGKPSEEGLYRDASAAWHYLVEQQGATRENTLLFGRSLGAGVATRLALEIEPAGVVIESAFTSVPDMAADLYPLLPVRLLSRNHFDNLKHIPDMSSALLVMHSKKDEIIPYHHGEKLYAAAVGPKQFFQLQGGHNDGFIRSGSGYLQAWRAFLDLSLR
jgi:fermentation-respiration switch protein FrsA (DUF1100 family)